MEEKFNIIKKGYDPNEVNKYIDELEAVVKSYKEKDTAIKNAILNAQIAADSIVEKSRAEAADIVGKAKYEAAGIVAVAKTEAAGIKEETLRYLDKAEGIAASHRDHVGSLFRDYNTFIQRFVSQLDESETNKLIYSAKEMEDYLESAKSSLI